MSNFDLEETNRIEFKREINDKLEKEVVGFLNYREGGTLYIGVDDDGSVVGISNPDEQQLKIKDRIKTRTRYIIYIIQLWFNINP